MRRDRLYLGDIVEAADAISVFLAGATADTFAQNDLVRSAVLQKLIVIGEAASHVSTELRAAHPELPWPDIVAFRNIAVHTYFSVNWSIVWVTATEEVPLLRTQIAGILASEP